MKVVGIVLKLVYSQSKEQNWWHCLQNGCIVDSYKTFKLTFFSSHPNFINRDCRTSGCTLKALNQSSLVIDFTILTLGGKES